MNKSQADKGDWSDDSELLFAAARTDHDASAADRARVRGALSARLAGGAAVTHPAGGGGGADASATKSAHGITLGNAVKLALTVALVATGSFAVVRMLERPAERTPAPQRVAPVPPASAALAHAHSTAPVAREQPSTDAYARSSSGKTVRAQTRAPARSAARRPRVGAAPAQRQTSGSTPLGRFDSKTASMVADPIEQSAPAAPAPDEAGPATAEALREAPSHDESLTARAELALVQRIHAAMRAANPSLALALCSEHERRWTNGVFVLEREGVRAIALCDLRSPRAAARARSFLASHARTPLAPRVEAACAEQLSGDGEADRR